MPGSLQAGDHVEAHLSKTDKSNFHRGSFARALQSACQSMRAGFGTSLNRRLAMSRPQFKRSGNVVAVRNCAARSPSAASRDEINRGTSTGAVTHRLRSRKNAFTKSSKKIIKRYCAVAGLSAQSWALPSQ